MLKSADTKKDQVRLLKPLLAVLFFISFPVMAACPAQAQIHTERPFDVWLGFSVTNQTVSFTGSATALNDGLGYKPGAGLHAHLDWNLNRRFVLRTGLAYQYFDWEVKDRENPVVNETGEPTGSIILTTLTRDFNLMYLGVPLHLKIHPYANHFYLIAGADFWYKFRHKVGLLDTFLIDPEDDVFELILSQRYSTPGFAEDFLIAGIAGLGFNFTLENIHLGIEFNTRRNLTPFFDREGVTQNFTQYGLSFSVRL